LSFNLDGTELHNETFDCRMLVYTRKNDAPQITLQLLKFVVSYSYEVFQNFRVALQTLLTIYVSIASCERSISKRGLIQTYLGDSVSGSRLK